MYDASQPNHSSGTSRSGAPDPRPSHWSGRTRESRREARAPTVQRVTDKPYDESTDFVASGRGVEGEPLAGSFDHVVAIDFNRRPGTSPLDPAKPEGAEKGGNIWLHVDHGGPSQGCVGVPREAMEQVLRTLDPAAQPVIVMGPRGF